MSDPAAEIPALVARWQARLGLDHWRLRVHIGTCADVRSAAAFVDPAYLTADLYFDPAGLTADDEPLEPTVVHELMHIPNWPLAALAERYAGDDPEKQDRIAEALEASTTLMERIVLRLAGVSAC